MAALLSESDRHGQIDWDLWCVDGTSIRALKAAAGARKRPVANEPEHHALGRSRGGFGCKVHLLCDSHGIVTAFRLSAGKVNECTEAIPLLESVGIGRKRRPRSLAGDKGYSTRAIRTWCRAHHVQAVTPDLIDQIGQRSRKSGRPLCFDRIVYRRRNVIERAVGWLKNLRRIAPRSEKLAIHHQSMITVALIARYATKDLSDTTLALLPAANDFRRCARGNLSCSPAHPVGPSRPWPSREWSRPRACQACQAPCGRLSYARPRTAATPSGS